MKVVALAVALVLPTMVFASSASSAAGEGAGVASPFGVASECVGCHGGGAEGPDYSTEFDGSQVAWVRQNHGRFGYWVEGRGSHVEGQGCTSCHQPHEAEPRPPSYPLTCDATCHAWLGDIDQAGYPSVFGPTGFQGSVAPEALLAVANDLDGDGRDHKAIYQRFGCAGFCHDPAMSLDKAEAWGASSADPGVPAGTLHGYIGPRSWRTSDPGVRACTACHRIVSPVGMPGSGGPDLHATHIAFIQIEKSFADLRDDAPQSACTYCHRVYTPDSPATAQPGGCYNCHLSGHRPETYYWAGSGK